jgi:hypothetical protein
VRLGRPRRSVVDYIKMDLGGMRWGGVDWTHEAQNREQWRALGNEPSGSVGLEVHQWAAQLAAFREGDSSVVSYW